MNLNQGHQDSEGACDLIISAAWQAGVPATAAALSRVAEPGAPWGPHELSHSQVESLQPTCLSFCCSVASYSCLTVLNYLK